MLLKNLLYVGILLFTLACAANRPGISSRKIKKLIEESPVFSTHFTGFALYDLHARKMVATQHASHYFTPASNTKLFTFYTSLKLLGDSIPGLRYTVSNDSLIFRGTGDPSFLHQDLKNTTLYTFLNQRTENLYYSPAYYEGRHFGPGWAWDDYNDYYSAEKSSFPLYGNIVRFQVDNAQQLHVYPHFFTNLARQGILKPSYYSIIQRDEGANTFTFYQDSNATSFTQDVPYKQSLELVTQLLSDTLHKPVTLINSLLPASRQTMYSIRADSLYVRLMQESDNFIAEQLLLLCSSTLSDTLSSEKTIAYSIRHLLPDLPDKPIWKDGSGLSRYNLFTPRSIVHLLEKIYKEVPQERLFKIFPAGGQSGTIKKWYASETNQPYVFAKTGTLANTHCLSGYLVTRKGKLLLFSFMHNNIRASFNEVRQEMQKVLKNLHDKY